MTKSKPIPVKVHIMPRLVQVGEYDMWERDMGRTLTDMDSSMLRTLGYVTGTIAPEGLHSLQNHPAVVHVDVSKTSLWASLLRLVGLGG